jgi:hypothetical protein
MLDDLSLQVAFESILDELRQQGFGVTQEESGPRLKITVTSPSGSRVAWVRSTRFEGERPLYYGSCYGSLPGDCEFAESSADPLPSMRLLSRFAERGKKHV